MSKLVQGQLQRWTEHSTLIFGNLKPVEKSKNILAILEHLQKLYWFSQFQTLFGEILREQK